MIDLDIIKENYASMPDNKLILIAEEEKQDLMPEALELLKQEFSRRGLDMSPFNDPVKDISAEEDDGKRVPVKGGYNPATNTDNNIKGLSYQEMMYPDDKSEEIDANKKAAYAKLSEGDIHTLIKTVNGAMSKNGFIFLIGLAVTIITFMGAEGGGRYVVAWGAIVFGAIGFFRALDTKQKLEAELKKRNTPKESSNDLF